MIATSLIDFLAQAAASCLLFAGIYETGNHRCRGPALATTSELIFIGVGIYHDVWSLSLVGVVLAVLQGRNFLKWRKEGVAF